MFIGHFAVGFVGKRLAPRASLGTYMAAAVFLDVLWPLFLLAGFETVKISPGLTAVCGLDFVSYPWSHSLLMAVIWSVLFGWTYHLIRHDAATAKALALVVFSHWVLDWVTHRPDLPLAPGIGVKTGLGLWRSLPATVAIEGAFFLAAAWWYEKSTEALDGIGRWALLAFVGVLLALYAASLGPPPPPGREKLIAWVTLTGFVFFPWAAWIDRHRISG